MADPDNFEDDLFADLYDDNDGSAAAPVATPATASAPILAQVQAQAQAHAHAQALAQTQSLAQAPAPAPLSFGIITPQAERAPEAQAESAPDDVGYGAAENGYGEGYHEDAYEEDDDVDFDLGNGSTNNTGAAPSKQEESPAPAFHTTRGPSAKEDG
ncbi:hypothetical protein GGR50DRAFT_424451 [Xylaria sp. CBS 124048]|nr:hypothetical protein GGR50DRAFT_424451 [Xylaria sp. CBS 124048]